MGTPKTRVGIVGAGPAGLSAASYLSQFSDFEVEMFESGRRSPARICPADRRLACLGCAGSCNVLSGVGGCIQPGDSIKLSMFPSGKRLLKHIGPENADFAIHQAMNFFGVDRCQFETKTIQKFGELDLRHYPIHEVDSRGVLELHEKFDAITKQVHKFHSRRKITKIRPREKSFFVEFNGKDTSNIEFDKIILATGRTGYNSIIDGSNSLNVVTRQPNISVGIRLELPAKMLVSMFQAHKDFKFSKTYGEHKIKSFCFSSAGLMGGRLKFCHYDCQFDYPVTLLDGHANYDQQVPAAIDQEAYGNIGLLVQLPLNCDSTWLNEVFLRQYVDQSGGKPIAQSLAGFLHEATGQTTTTVSVSDVVVGRVDRLFTGPQLSSLKGAILDVMNGISSNSEFTVDELIKAANCVGPEVEFFWPTADVSRHFQTNVPGLYVAGDATGIAQGNFQASACGSVAAYGITIGEEQYYPEFGMAAE